MHELRVLEAAEQHLERIGLHRLPDRGPRNDHQRDQCQHAPVEDLLRGVVGAKPMFQPEPRGGDEVA